MAQKFVQEIRTVQVTIQKPAGTKYTDQDVCNLLTIKSKEPKSIKVVGHYCEDTQAPE